MSVEPAAQDPILASIDERIAAANKLVGRLTVLRRLVEQAIELDVDQLPLLELDFNGNGADSDGGAEAEPERSGDAQAPGRPAAAVSAEPETPPKRQGGGLG